MPVHSCMNTFMSRLKTYVIGYDCIAIDLCGNHSTSQPTENKNKTEKATPTTTTAASEAAAAVAVAIK